MRIPLGLTVSFTLLSISMAQADWQFTKWGMSAESLEKLGGGNVIRIPAREQAGLKVIGMGEALLRSGYKAQEIAFTANYYFANDKLIAVSLKTASTEDGIKTRSRLQALYGKPDSHEKTGGGCSGTRWRDQREGNMITFHFCAMSITEGIFEVRYEPIPSSKGGL